MFDDAGRFVPALSQAEILDAPDHAAAYLAALPPGPDAGEALSLLDPGALSEAGRVDLLVAVERQLGWLHAVQQRVLATMAEQAENAARPGDPSGQSWVREDVACALRLSGQVAADRLDAATELVRRAPRALRLLERGDISYLHARSLSDATAGLDDEQAREVQERVLGRAPEQTLANFRRSVARAVQSVDAVGVEGQRQLAMCERRVCVTPRADGMAQLWALVPAAGAAALMAGVNALASVTSSDDERTLDQRRADALVDLGVAALHDPRLPKAQGMRPAVQVTVALSTLLAMDDQPGELAGHGPIPATLARELAADPTGTWRRLVTDPLTGQLVDHGAKTYRPPKRLTDYVLARDQVCTFPGCNRPARQCDIDHEQPFAEGGATCSGNLVPRCRRHHIAKHRGGWRTRRDPASGVSIWTSPTGHRYRSRPPAYPVDRTVTSDPDPPRS